MKLRILLILFVIFLLAFVLRVYELGDYPSGFHRDEVFLGYNAYSILKTGKDISGIFLPIHLKSFLYTPAGYSYFSIPFIAIFGLSEFSVRFASALFGALSVVVLYFLAVKLFLKITISKIKINPILGGFISSVLLAISPWHINLSRTASVSTLVTFFILLGMVLSLKWFENKKNIFLIFSFLAFGMSMAFYIAPYSFLPIFIPAFFIFFTSLKSKRRIIPVGILYLGIIIIPLVITFLSPTLSLRARSLSILGNEKGSLVVDEKIREDGVAHANLFATRAFHNKPAEYINQFFENYFSQLSYNFFFTDQALPDRYRIPQVGLLYFFELPLILLGLWATAKHGIKTGLFLIVWIVMVPIGSAMTFDDVPNLQRTLFMFPPLIILETIGIFFVFSLVKMNFRKISSFTVVSIVIVSVVFYLHQYYVHGFIYRPWYRQDGYKELVGYVNKILPGYKYTVVTNRESAPTLFFLFYGKIDPAIFQSETKNTKMQDFDRIGFGKYKFSQEECPMRETVSQNGIKSLSGEKGVLYVNSGLCSVPEKIPVLKTIKRSDNSKVFEILSQANK